MSICWWFTSPPAGTRTRPARTRARAFTTGCGIASRAGPSLAILHRLDKETSGVLVFGKTPLANRSLTEQFTQRRVRKKYLLLTDRPVPQENSRVKTALVRVGEKYVSRPPHAGKSRKQNSP